MTAYLSDPREDVRRRLLALDVETDLVQPGLLAPPLACGSVATPEPGSERFLTAGEARAEFRRALRSDAVLSGANFAYDVAVLLQDAADEVGDFDELVGLVLDKYDRGEVYDVLRAQELDAIAGGHLFLRPDGGYLYHSSGERAYRYSLDLVVLLVLGRADAKARDTWRKSYAVLRGVPYEKWPHDAVQYPRDDARNTADVAASQVLGHRNLRCLPHEVRAALALHLSDCRGLRTDPVAVAKLRARVDRDREQGAGKFRALGWLTPGETADDSDKSPKAPVKRAMARAWGARRPCEVCRGAGKVRAGKRGKDVCCTSKNLEVALAHRVGVYSGLSDADFAEGTYAEPSGCDGTGLVLADAPLLARTEKTGAVQCGRDLMSESGDEDLMAFAVWKEDDKAAQTYLPFLEQGVERPVTPRSNVLVESGRASYDGVVMTLPRDGDVRPCVVPREGYCFSSADYDAGELVGLAQVCLWVVGRSVMAEVINATKDPSALHTRFAARLLGCSLDEAKRRIKAGDDVAIKYRQAAKPFNFGLPGGMGAAKLVLSKRKKSEGFTLSPGGPHRDRDGRAGYNGIRFCVLLAGAERCGGDGNVVQEWKRRPCAPVCRRCCEVAEQARREWLEEWEMRPYFDWVAANVDATGQIESLGTGMVRGGLGFTDGANHSFQHLISRCAKRAAWLVTRECWDPRRKSPLLGSRMVMFYHDETFLEVPSGDRARRDAAARRQAVLMVEGAREYITDVHVSCSPAIMPRWYKGAKEKVGEDGLLDLWEPA